MDHLEYTGSVLKESNLGTFVHLKGSKEKTIFRLNWNSVREFKMWRRCEEMQEM
jgi:hypothetical protein